MTHEHDQGCRHDLRFCYQCDVAYCGKCDLNWARHQPTWYIPNPPVVWPDTTIYPTTTLPYTITSTTSANHTNHMDAEATI